MYEEFYGFVQSPFTLAPDPRFLYLSESHDEAIQLLLQAIRRKEGFIVLTGDIGTGKTTVCRALLEQLDMTTFTSLVLNPFLSVEELLREILLDFGVVSREAVRSGRIAAATKHELVSTLHEFLLSLDPDRRQRRAHHRRGAAPVAARCSRRFACCRTWRPTTRSCCRSCWSASSICSTCWRTPRCGSSISASRCARC